jgi:FKBP-type peptidyl-prolyl cis-trans isomerase FklB
MLKRSLLHGAAAIMVLSLPSMLWAQNEVIAAPDANPPEPVGYLIGHSIGGQLRQNGFRVGDFTVESFIAGINAGLEGKEFALDDETVSAAEAKIQAMLQPRQQEMMARQREMVARQKVLGTQFLAENSKREGVKVLEGGVQYKVLESGEGASPGPSDTVSVHYTGTLINGEVFDSSVQGGQPVTFPVNGVIPGWQMALQKMKVGDKWMLYIPSELAYGERGSRSGAIGPNEVLVFEVELLAVAPEGETP